MKIKNSNFICEMMQKRDVEEAFELEGKSALDGIYQLIADGYLHKKAGRFYTPTQKLLDEVFLPKCGFVMLEDHQRRFLSAAGAFYFKDLVMCLWNNETIVNRMIVLGYFRLETDRRYRKGTALEDMLAEGQDMVKL